MITVRNKIYGLMKITWLDLPFSIDSWRKNLGKKVSVSLFVLFLWLCLEKPWLTAPSRQAGDSWDKKQPRMMRTTHTLASHIETHFGSKKLSTSIEKKIAKKKISMMESCKMSKLWPQAVAISSSWVVASGGNSGPKTMRKRPYLGTTYLPVSTII